MRLDDYNNKKLGINHKKLNLDAENLEAFNDILRMAPNDLQIEKEIIEEIQSLSARIEYEMSEWLITSNQYLSGIR